MIFEDLNLKIKSFAVYGILTTTIEKIWIEDEFHPSGEGGYYMSVEKTLEKPLAKIDFSAEIPEKMAKHVFPGDVLQDENGVQYAVFGNSIRIADTNVENFYIPTKLVVTYSTYIEGQSPRVSRAAVIDIKNGYDAYPERIIRIGTEVFYKTDKGEIPCRVLFGVGPDVVLTEPINQPYQIDIKPLISTDSLREDTSPGGILSTSSNDTNIIPISEGSKEAKERYAGINMVNQSKSE